MKKRILALVAMVAVLATAMSLCVSSLSVSAKKLDREQGFSSLQYFTGDELVYDIARTKYSERIGTPAVTNDAGYDNYKHQGVQIRRDSLEAESGYLYLFDRGEDMNANLASAAGKTRLFWNTTATSFCYGTETPMEIEVVFKKDGADWEAGKKALDFSFTLWSTKASSMSNTEYEALGLNPADFKGGNYKIDLTEKLNGSVEDGSYTLNEETGWCVLKTSTLVPAVYDSEATRVYMHYQYSNGATEEVETLNLMIKRVVFSVELTLGFETHEATFDKANPTNVEIKANVTSESTMEMFDDKGIIDPDGNYYLDEGKIVIKKEYLNTLSNGTYTFKIEVDGDSASAETFVVTVVDGANAGASEGGCGSVIGATSAVLATALLAGAVVVFKKKD
ncbi:MAG: hypothetical protein E7342_05230 [Clostridiales bacterium]|nr:hypothetical protein [Clostridiales bacterium]